MYLTSWSRQIACSPTGSRLGRRLVEGTLSPNLMRCSNLSWNPPSHFFLCIMFFRANKRVTQVSIKGCWWRPIGHYTERAHSVNPYSFAGRFLHHLVLFSSPRWEELRLTRTLSLIGMWQGAKVKGDYLAGFIETGAQLWSTKVKRATQLSASCV